jgi:pimeloyl-ACP methyl ester carboxylesterase
MRVKKITVDGVNLECRRIGARRGPAPTLVFLHDGLGCVDIWGDFPHRLTRRTGLPGFVYSRAGYGRSDPVPLPRPLNYMHIEAAHVLPAVLAASGIEQAILVGHSDGATISLIYGALTGGGIPAPPAAPQAAPRAAAIVAMAPHVFNEALSITSIRETTRQFEGGTLRGRLERYHGENVDCAFRGWSDAWLDPLFRAWNIEAMLAAIDVPVLVIQGDADAYGTLAQVESILRNVSGPVRAHIIPGCDHVPYREAPEITLEAIAGFLRDPEGLDPEGNGRRR